MTDIEPLNEERKRSVAAVFDSGASTYDRVGSRFFSHFGQRLVEIVQPKEGSRVLDVATGRGAILFPVVKRLGNNGYVIGIDISPAMVKETTYEITQLGFTNVEASIMDVEDMHFPDGSFDYVLCGFGLAFFPQLGRALSECRRVLSSGGRFAATCFVDGENLGFPWVRSWLSANLPPQILQKVISQIAKPRLADPWLKTPELKSVISEAGFKDVEVFSEEAEFVFDSVEEWWAMLNSIPPVRAMLGILEKEEDPKIMERLKADAAERLKNHRQEDGYHHSITALVVQAEVD
jgi:O-methyltransferase/aklanonic acid methyltransferase